MAYPVLIVDDDPLQRRMLSTLLKRRLDYESFEAANGKEALKQLEGTAGQHVRLVILDLTMPVMGGMETLNILRERYPSLPVIMLTGSRDIEDAIRAMKAGAIDFLNKPYEGERMLVTVKNALRLSTLSKEVTRLKNTQEGRFGFDSLVGHDAGLAPVVAAGYKAARADLPVLMTGETGTGKEVFARAIHGESARAGKPFIAVNCGAIPAQLVESTLFGHEKGAFTGATDKVPGKFREADGGTIFLDEIGELPLEAQVKMLRVLQQKEVEPVGAGKSVPVNVRVISATNRDLEEEVAQGRFREDLFFRLNVLPLNLLPLRERRGDILALIEHFIERHYASDERAILPDISEAALSMLRQHHWPGNVRELENAINRAMVMNDDQCLDLDDFAFLPGGTAASIVQETVPYEQPGRIAVLDQAGQFKTAGQIEREAMALALSHTGHNVTQAAKALGMAKSTFYRKMGEDKD